MKSKHLIFLLIFLLNHPVSSQNFEYERTWGTYFGPTGGQIASQYHALGIVFDSQKNMYMRGHIWHQASYPNTYYDQFLLGGGEPYNGSGSLFKTRITPTGTPTFYGYDQPVSSSFDLLEAIDQQDNQYHIVSGTSPSVQATAGTFLSTDPQPSSNRKVLLAKYSSTGTLLWATYLPFESDGSLVTTDPLGNVYVHHETIVSQNMTTPNVWQENFDLQYDPQGNIIPNGFLIKLNSNGQRVWATYMPTTCGVMQYFNGALYMLGGPNSNTSLDTMSTPAAFQTLKADISLTKLDVSTGTRQWGTYYGPPYNTSIFTLYDLAVNETGIYLAGTDYNDSGTNFFGTPGSYKPTVTGGSDIFLSKFSHSGMREWSTYFGNSGVDMNDFDKVIALNGNDIYITGNTYGVGNNIATAGAYQTAPETNASNSINYYFAKFNSSGNFIWCSYYGGTSIYPGIGMPLNVAFDNNVLYLFGSTNSNTGYTTEGAWMPVRNPANTNQTTAFIARFDNKNLMGTSEADLGKDLILYDNPNNGDFSITGSILQKENCILTVFDTAGRNIFQQKLSKNKTQEFNLQRYLASSNYLVEVKRQDGSKLKVFKMVVKK